MKILNEKEFEVRVLKNEKIVIVDFFATWCGPCQMFAPVLEQLASEINDVEVYKVNIDEASELTEQYGIESVPTIIFFKNGGVVRQEIGTRSIEEMKRLIEEIK